MSGYKVPDDLEEQTRVLIKNHIAHMVMRFLPSQRASARDATLEECKFWARMIEDRSRVHLQIVVQYPSNQSDDAGLLLGCAITVAAAGGAWRLANGETLDANQIALVESLAGRRPSR